MIEGRESPLVIVLAGPNGAGKSTAASRLLPEDMTFVNADNVAKTLAEYPSRQADFEAGRIVVEMMSRLESAGADFAVETTLASRSLASRLAHMRRSGYRVRLIFTFLPDPEFSIERVARRVRLGAITSPRKRSAGDTRQAFGTSSTSIKGCPIAGRCTIQRGGNARGSSRRGDSPSCIGSANPRSGTA